MKRTLWILLTPTVLLFLLVGAVELILFPKISDWALGHAKAALKTQAGIELSVGKTNLSLYRISIFLSDLKISGRIPGLDQPVSIDRIQVRIDPLGLILGQLRISAIIIDNTYVKINLDKIPKDDSQTPLPLQEIFQWTDKIPIERLALRRSHLHLSSEKFKLSTQIKPLDMLVTNLKQRLIFKFYAPGVSITSTEWPDPLGLSLESMLTIEKDKINIQALQIMSAGQTLKGQASFTDASRVFIKPRGRAKVEINSDLEPLTSKLKIFLKSKFPEVTGRVHFESEFDFNGADNLSGATRLETQQIQIGNFQLGSLKAAGRLQGESLNLAEISISHPAGIAKLSNNSLGTKSPFNFNTNISVEHMDLQKLLIALDLKKVPVWLDLKGNLPCAGQIQNFDMKCKGQISAKNIKVQSGMSTKDKIIIEIPEGDAEGEVSVDTDRVKLDTKVRFKDSVGTFGGEVFYKEGFDFKFNANKFNFTSIKNLSDLAFVGQGTFSGMTRGDSESAILEIQTQLKDFYFEKYFLGDVSTQIRYEQGHLKIENADGNLPLSNYQAEIDVNLNKSTLSGKIKAGKTDLKDITLIFSDVYKFPMDIVGPGSAEIDFWGPFDFWKMNYNLKSSFQNGVVQGESFSTFDFNIQSDNGNIKTQQVELKKNASMIRATGTIGSDRKIEMRIDGTNLRMEESEIVNKIKGNLVGALNFNIDMSGPITGPELSAKGHLAELLVDDQEIPSSFFQFKLNKELLTGETNLFGNRIQSDFQIPVGDKALPLRLRAKTNAWNFSNALILAGAAQLQQEYESQMTSEVDLSSDSGDWKSLSGSITIKDFFLKRGNLSVRNPETVDIKLNKGNIEIKKFHLTGANTDIHIRGQNFSVTNLNVAIEAKSDLRLGHILLPFLDDIGGPFKLTAALTGSYKKPELLGNAKIENTFIKIKGFPHPAEKMKADFIFSHSRILIQNIKGIAAGGSLYGEGAVQIVGINEIPTNIRLTAEGLNLNFPDKIKSQGDAKLNFSGRWFPFVLSGSYNIKSGLVEKEFTEEVSGPTQIRESIYLPKTLKESTFDPILVDLQVNIDRNMLVKNSMMDGSVTGQLQAKGTPQNPSVTGKIFLEKNSKLIIKDKVFEVITGNAQFNNPNELNPELFVSAQSRVNDYDVNLLVQGPSKNPTIRWSSLPPLPEQEIISLMALGITSQKLDQGVSSREQANQIGYEAMAATVGAGANKYLQSKLGVNLQITSGFDNTKNVNVPKVTFSKKISRKWTTSFSQGMGSEQTSREVKIQYQIDNNLSAVGSWEGRDLAEGNSISNVTKESQSVFGLDLEFKREFK